LKEGSAMWKVRGFVVALTILAMVMAPMLVVIE
jgi:hypothetical protein